MKTSHTLLATFAVALLSASAHAELPALLGDDDATYGANGCVADLEYDFSRMSDNRGEHNVIALDARDDAAYAGLPGAQPPLDCAVRGAHHVQGIARLPMPDNTVVFVGSRNTRLAEAGDAAGVFAASLTQLRSWGGHVGSFDAGPENSAIAYITTDDDADVDDLRPIDHYGGLATLGLTVVVGGECLWDKAACEHEPARVDVFDFSDPYQPTMVSRIVLPAEHDAGNVGVVRLADGRALVLVNLKSAYVSSDDSAALGPSTTWSLAGTVDHEATRYAPGSGGWPDGIENISLVTECGTQRIYMIATRAGEMSLFLLHGEGDTVQLEKRARRRVYPAVASLDAAGSIFVGPEAHLLFYSARKCSYDHGVDAGQLELEEFGNALNLCNDVLDLRDPHDDPTRALACETPDGSAMPSMLLGLIVFLWRRARRFIVVAFALAGCATSPTRVDLQPDFQVAYDHAVKAEHYAGTGPDLESYFIDAQGHAVVVQGGQLEEVTRSVALANIKRASEQRAQHGEPRLVPEALDLAGLASPSVPVAGDMVVWIGVDHARMSGFVHRVDRNVIVFVVCDDTNAETEACVASDDGARPIRLPAGSLEVVYALSPAAHGPIVNVVAE